MLFIFSVFAFILMVIIGQWLSRCFYLFFFFLEEVTLQKLSSSKTSKMSIVNVPFFYFFILLILLNNQENFSLVFCAPFIHVVSFPLPILDRCSALNQETENCLRPCRSRLIQCIFFPFSNDSPFLCNPWEYISKQLCVYMV